MILPFYTPKFGHPPQKRVMKFGDPPHYNFSTPHAVVNGVSLNGHDSCIESPPMDKSLHYTTDFVLVT